MRDDKRQRPPQEAEADGLIEGRNAVIEALRAGTPIDKIYIARGETDATLGYIASTARGKGVVVTEADRRKLDGMSRTKSHQGVIAIAAVREYAEVDDLLNAAREKGEPPLLVVSDELSPQPGGGDPHGGVRRGPWGDHPQAAFGGAYRHRGENQRGGGELPARGPGAQPDCRAEGAEGAGAVGVRHRRRRGDQPVPGGFEGPRRPGHRQRGGRHGPSGPGAV